MGETITAEGFFDVASCRNEVAQQAYPISTIGIYRREESTTSYGFPEGAVLDVIGNDNSENIATSLVFYPHKFYGGGEISSIYLMVEDPLENKFKNLSKKWREETKGSSVIARRYQHPAYIQILEMKEAAISLILKELRTNPDRWFEALEKLTGQNPAKDSRNFYEAVDQWISWGFANGYLE